MKKLVFALFAVLLLFTACGTAAPSSTVPDDSSEASASISASSTPEPSSVPASSSLPEVSSVPASSSVSQGGTETFTHTWGDVTFSITLPQGIRPQSDGLMQSTLIVPSNVLNDDFDFPSKLCWLFTGGGDITQTGDETWQISDYDGEVLETYTRSDSLDVNTWYEWDGYIVFLRGGSIHSYSPPEIDYYSPQHDFCFGFFYNGTAQDAIDYYDAIMETVIFE